MAPGIISWALFSGTFPHLDRGCVLDRICNRMFEPAAKHIGEFTRYNMHRPTRDQGQGPILNILGRWNNQEFVADLQSVQQLECLQVGFGMWAPKLWAARMQILLHLIQTQSLHSVVCRTCWCGNKDGMRSSEKDDGSSAGDSRREESRSLNETKMCS